MRIINVSYVKIFIMLILMFLFFNRIIDKIMKHCVVLNNNNIRCLNFDFFAYSGLDLGQSIPISK
jgi:hypothetical protein